jgi:hypothetical protein
MPSDDPKAADQPAVDQIFQILLETTEESVSHARDAESEDANEGPIEITVICDGFIVTGELISTREFLELFWDGVFLETDETADEETTLRKALAKGNGTNPITFFHLKNALIVGSLTEVGGPQSGLLWRGRVDAVAGFTLGRFSRNV